MVNGVNRSTRDHWWKEQNSYCIDSLLPLRMDFYIGSNNHFQNERLQYMFPHWNMDHLRMWELQNTERKQLDFTI